MHLIKLAAMQVNTLYFLRAVVSWSWLERMTSKSTKGVVSQLSSRRTGRFPGRAIESEGVGGVFWFRHVYCVRHGALHVVGFSPALS